MERILNKQAKRDSTPNRTATERVIVRKRKLIENLVVENLNRKSTVTRLTRMEAILTITATISPAGRSVELIDAKQRSTEEYPDEIETPTRIAL